MKFENSPPSGLASKIASPFFIKERLATQLKKVLLKKGILFS